MDIKAYGISADQMPSVGMNKGASDGSVFAEMYQKAIDMLEDTNTLAKDADQMTLDFAAGKIDNIQDVMIAQEKASIALQYTVQVRDKVLEAYNEIMRIQI